MYWFSHVFGKSTELFVRLFFRLLTVKNTINNKLLNVSNRGSRKTIYTVDLVHLLQTYSKKYWLGRVVPGVNTIIG